MMNHMVSIDIAEALAKAFEKEMADKKYDHKNLIENLPTYTIGGCLAFLSIVFEIYGLENFNEDMAKCLRQIADGLDEEGGKK